MVERKWHSKQSSEPKASAGRLALGISRLKEAVSKIKVAAKSTRSRQAMGQYR